MAEQIALVTGAGRGIGKAIAESLAEDGFRVVVSDFREEAATTAADDITKRGLLAEPAAFDVRSEKEVSEAVAAIEARHGRLNVLVNNAGVLSDAFILDVTEADWDLLLDTNLKGAFLCSKAVTRGMMDRRYGRIINVSSIGGKDGFPLAGVNYSASKAGMLGLTRQLAKQVAPYGITVNAVAPGTTDTGMIDHRSEEQRAWIISQIPAGRLGIPQDTAWAVCFLASEESGFITGETLDVCGGLFMG